MHYAFEGLGDTLSITVLNSGGNLAQTGDLPNGWFYGVGGSGPYAIWAFCQSPITVAGIGVPQFGSLYLAIALGAMVYFVLSKRIARDPTTPNRGIAS